MSAHRRLRRTFAIALAIASSVTVATVALVLARGYAPSSRLEAPRDLGAGRPADSRRTEAQPKVVAAEGGNQQVATAAIPELPLASLAGVRVRITASLDPELELHAEIDPIACSQWKSAASVMLTQESGLSKEMEFCVPGPLELGELVQDTTATVALSAYQDEVDNAAQGMEGLAPLRYKLFRATGTAGGQRVEMTVGALSSKLCADVSCTTSAESLSVGASLSEPGGGVSLPVLGVSGGLAAASLR